MKQLSEDSKPIQPSGYLLPWNKRDEQPCFIAIEGVEFIPVFSTEEKLNKHLDIVGYNFEVSIKMINDTDEFMDSVQPYRVALDLWHTERNTTRFTEIKLTSK
jgi:hypothetical protein